jgi:hypothetical protein
MQLSARQQIGGNSPLPRRAALDDAAGWGSLNVTGGARIIGAGKRRCRKTTGGYQSLWMPRMALGPRLLLNKQNENGPVSRCEGRVFCATTQAPLVQASFRNCLADPHRSPLFLIKTGTNFLKGSIQTPGKDELQTEYLFA